MTIDSARLSRAVSSRTATRREDGTWLVTGGAEPHITTADTCDCADHRIRGTRCMHILLVRLHQGDGEVIAALRVLAPQQQRRPAKPVPVSPPIEPVPEAGALTLWRREVHAGIRTMYTDDELREAAILEANARDEIRDGMIAAANESRRAAAAILVRRFARAVA